MTDDRPLVSIGLPVYNGADRVVEAIESVLAQNYQNLELVISDNASEDETGSICQRYADADPRVRYMRNATNLGFLPNFRRVLGEAKGKYFSWLAHDDLLSDRSYLSRVVDYLESHPETVGCTTALYILDNEVAGSVEPMDFPQLAPERWPRSRNDLFRWPHGWLDATIFGVFRRRDLDETPIPDRTYKGQPHIFCWEMDVLTNISTRGAVVVLPDRLRSYRLSTGSVGMQIGWSVSSFDLLVLGLRMRLVLLLRALRAPVSPRERVRLLATTIGNFFRANLWQVDDRRTVSRQREKELRMLLRVAQQRRRLIISLRARIARGREQLRAQGKVTPDELVAGPDPGATPEIPPGLLRRRGVRPKEFFVPLDQSEIDRFHRLNEHIARLRGHCARQLQVIEAMHAEAVELKRRIAAPG